MNQPVLEWVQRTLLTCLGDQGEGALPGGNLPWLVESIFWDDCRDLYTLYYWIFINLGSNIQDSSPGDIWLGFMIILPRSEKGMIAIHVGFPNTNQPEFPKIDVLFFVFFVQLLFDVFLFFLFSPRPDRLGPCRSGAGGFGSTSAGLVPRGFTFYGFVGV